MAKYIDADMAIEKLSCINPTEPTIWYSDAVEAINNTPAADVVERKIGQWEEIRVMPEAYDITGEKTWASVMRCNKCGFEAFAIEGHFAQYHFCPNCGADMRGEE